MLLTDHVVLDVGGAVAVAIEHAEAAITAVTVAVYSGSGGEELAATTATHPPLATTLSVGLQPGERFCDVSALSAGDLQPGDTFKVAPTNGRAQVLTCQEIDPTGKRITFAEEALFEAPSGSVVFGLVCRYTVAASVADATWWNGYAKWTPTWSAAAQAPVHVPLHCVTYPIPRRMVGLADLQRRFGRLERLVPLDSSLEKQIDEAQVRALDSLIADGLPPHVLIPYEKFKVLVCLAWMLDRRFSISGGVDFEALGVEYHHERDRVIASVQRDLDQDGGFDPSERPSPRCHEVIRA